MAELMTPRIDMRNVHFSPHWRLVRDLDTIRCVGGPDEFYVLTEVDSDTLDSIESWIRTGTAPTSPSGEMAEVCDFLQTIGALDRPPSASDHEIQWQSIGPDGPMHKLAEAVASAHPTSPAELTVVVRTGGTLDDVLGAAEARNTSSHLLIDLTGHHTVSLGPFVTPGFTACMGCYSLRISREWGDELGAPEPASQRWIAVAAELISIQLEQIARRRSPLIDATMSWDLTTGKVAHDKLLRLQRCPACAPSRSGSVPLAWTQ